MELNQLKYFCAFASVQHVTRAAEALHIAQPALTKSLHKLEEEIGVPLLCAKGRQVALTEYGQYLYERLREPLRTLDSLPDEVRAMAHSDETSVRINVLAASTVVTNAIIAYKKEHPNVQFSVIQNEETLSADICVDTDNAKSGVGEHAEFDEDILLAVPAEPRFESVRTIHLKEVADKGFVCLAGNKKFRGICDRCCAKAGFSPRIIFESDNPAAVRNLIQVGSGVGFWPQYTWDAPGDGVRLLPIADRKFSRRIHLYYTGGTHGAAHPVSGDFFHYLCACFSHLIG